MASDSTLSDCPTCSGLGTFSEDRAHGHEHHTVEIDCSDCEGTGQLDGSADVDDRDPSEPDWSAVDRAVSKLERQRDERDEARAIRRAS